MDGDGQHARQRAEAEGDDEDQREHDLRNGAAELEDAARREAPTARDLTRLAERREAQARSAPRRRSACRDRRSAGLDEQLQPALQPPEPFGDIRRQGRERQLGTVLPKIGEEAPDVAEQTCRSRPRPSRRTAAIATRKQDGAEQRAAAAWRRRQRDRPRSSDLKLRRRGSWGTAELTIIVIARQGAGGRDTAPPAPVRRDERQDFFLRSRSTNLFSSTIGS